MKIMNQENVQKFCIQEAYARLEQLSAQMSKDRQAAEDMRIGQNIGFILWMMTGKKKPVHNSSVTKKMPETSPYRRFFGYAQAISHCITKWEMTRLMRKKLVNGFR